MTSTSWFKSLSDPSCAWDITGLPAVVTFRYRWYSVRQCQTVRTRTRLLYGTCLRDIMPVENIIQLLLSYYVSHFNPTLFVTSAFHFCKIMLFIPQRRWTLVLCLSTAVHATFLFNPSRLSHSSKFPCNKYLLPTLTHNGKRTTQFLSISSLESKIDAIEGDSIERFSQDVSKVLNELRPELLDETLPGKIIEECESKRNDCG